MPDSPRLNSRVPQAMLDQVDQLAATRSFTWAGELNRSKAVQLLLDWGLKTLPADHNLGDTVEVSPTYSSGRIIGWTIIRGEPQPGTS